MKRRALTKIGPVVLPAELHHFCFACGAPFHVWELGWHISWHVSINRVLDAMTANTAPKDRP